jgi:hypothetical protein
VRISKQIIFYQVTSRSVTLLKFICASVQVSDILVFTVCFKLINFVFQILLYLKGENPKCSVSFSSYVIPIISIWTGFWNHCNLASFLLSNNCEHSSSNHCLCCCNAQCPRLSLAEILIFSPIFSQPYWCPHYHSCFSKLQTCLRFGPDAVPYFCIV